MPRKGLLNFKTEELENKDMTKDGHETSEMCHMQLLNFNYFGYERKIAIDQLI